MPILDRLQGPADLRGLSEHELEQLATDIRETIIRTVAVTGGHLGSSLGVVEITLALHRLLESPRDRIVWDTGHQAYAHKLLTGRLERFHTLRQIDGIGGFPRRTESAHDVFDGGHAGTGLSIAEGLATARDMRHSLERIAVVVGDAALLSGLSLEALNDIGHRQSQLLIVLNDNEMSISPSVGALSKYLSEIKLSTAWQQSKTAYDRVTEHIPFVGPRLLELSRRFRQSVVSFAQPGQLFEDLGITYVGVMPGHDLRLLEETFRRALALPGPVLVHVRTQKGKGYRPAERDQVSFHGAALPPIPVAPTDAHDRLPAIAATGANGANARMDDGDSMTSGAAGGSQVTQGRAAESGAPPSASVMADRRTPATLAAEGAADPPEARSDDAPSKTPNYTAFFATELVALGAVDRRIVAITAGMPTGTGLAKFQAAYPDRFVDVGIAEQHAVTLATGLALGRDAARGRPVLDVPPARVRPDRPRRVPERRPGPPRGRPGRPRGRGRHEPPGHVHDPGPADAAEPRRREPASDEQELRSLLRTALAQDHPFALHYPRDAGFGVPEREPEALPVGRGEVLREGRDLLFVTLRADHGPRARGRRRLEARGWSVGVINARFAKPLDQPAHPRPGARQVARRDVRGERRDRRVRLGGPRGIRGGAACRPRLPLVAVARDRDPRRPVRRPGCGHRPAAPHPARRARAHGAGRRGDQLGPSGGIAKPPAPSTPRVRPVSAPVPR